MKNILNIHGLMWSGKSHWDDFFKELGHSSYSPDLRDWQPSKVYAELQDLVKSGRYDVIVGRSLGGFYAYNVSIEFGLPTILFNPSLMVHINGEGKLSAQKLQALSDIYDRGQRLLSNQNHNPVRNSHLFIGMEDKVVPPAHALEQFEGGNIYQYEHIEHRFSRHLNEIKLTIKEILTDNP